MKQGVMGLVAALALCLVGNVASASLIGDTVGIELEAGSTILLDETVVVAGGAEITANFDDMLDLVVDVQTGAILLRLSSSVASPALGVAVAAGEFRFTDLDWLPDPGVLANATIQTNSQNLPLSLSFSGDSVTLAFDEFMLMGRQTAVVRVDLTAEHPTSTIPEPATVGLLALGLAGFAVRSRRRMA